MTSFTSRRRRSAPTGRRSTDAPITWSYTYAPDDSIARAGWPGHHRSRSPAGFAGNYPGATRSWPSPARPRARRWCEVAPRDVRRRITVIGRGNIARHAHVGPLAVDRQGRPRLRARRHVGRRRLRDHLRHHRPEQHRQDRLGAGRCPHDQRRDGLARRPLWRALARRRIEPRERRRDPRPREPGPPEDRVDVQPGADGRRAQHVRHQRLPLRGLGRRRSTSSSTSRTSTSRST